MKILITLSTLENGKFSYKVLSRLNFLTPMSSIQRRMSELAFKYFGENRIAINDRSLSGYFAHKLTGQTIEMEHSHEA